MTNLPESPQTRLAASRKTLIRYMARDENADASGPGGASGAAHFDAFEDQQSNGRRSTWRASTWQVFKHAVLRWWQHHPAHMAVDIGRPFLNSYARSKPLQLLGIAAAVGAAAVIVKPWRLVSVTGLALAAVKSTRLSTTLLSLLPRVTPPSRPTQTQQPTKDSS